MQHDQTILVAEDDELIRAIMCEVLADHGFTPIGASSTPEALSVVESPIDLAAAFIDIDLGDRAGGYQVARKVRELRPDVKIVYTSGGPRGDFELERVHDAIFVQKPYYPERVCDLLRDRAA